MRCCRNFSCIEWVCVCKWVSFAMRTSSYYAALRPTIHIILLEIFGIHFFIDQFLLPFFWNHDFELPRRESNMKHLLLLNVHFDSATSKVTIWLRSHFGQSHWTRSIFKSSSTRSVNFITASHCHMHSTNTHTCFLRTWVYAMPSHSVASSEIHVWLTFVYISKFHSNPIIILSSQNDSQVFLIYFYDSREKKPASITNVLGAFFSSVKPRSVYPCHESCWHNGMCILQLLRERKNEWTVSNFSAIYSYNWNAFECDLL